MREYESLIGKRFGMLTVREQLPSDKSGNRRWLCVCDCGNTSAVTTGNLRSGHTRSCGCIKQVRLEEQRFGRLTVLELSEERLPRGEQKRLAWKCRCECGNIVYRTSESLQNNKERMCAECARRESVRKAVQEAGFVEGTQISKLKSTKLSAANTSGCRGVYWNKRQKKWEAKLKFKGKLMSFGAYFDFEDAVKARKRAEEEIYGAFLEEQIN